MSGQWVTVGHRTDVVYSSYIGYTRVLQLYIPYKRTLYSSN